MFTKLHKEERQLLFKTNSAVAYEVYMHLKDKYSYFKAECYDLKRCIAEYLDIPERTVKDAIKRLKKVGLITTKLKGKVNMYSFPILDKIEGKQTIEENIPTEVEEMDNKEVQSSITEQAENEFISDEKKYGSRVMDFIDENGPEVMNIIRIKVECKLNPSEEIYRLSGNADVKLNDMIMSFGLTDDEKPNLLRLLNDYKNEEINKRLKVA